MLGNLGHFGDHIILAGCTDGVWSIVRAGREVPVWLGRDAISTPIATLEPDCALSLLTTAETALDGREPYHLADPLRPQRLRAEIRAVRYAAREPVGSDAGSSFR
jgi:hypothetical protein